MFENEVREQYGCKEAPDIRLSLMDGNEVIYKMTLNTLVSHKMEFGSRYKRIQFSTALMNNKDYAVLISKVYEKYVVETQQYWRSAEDGKDHVVELPAQVFHDFEIEYETECEGEPARWKFTFEEWIDED